MSNKFPIFNFVAYGTCDFSQLTGANRKLARYGLGGWQTGIDASARNTATPVEKGQLFFQGDNESFYVAASTTVGDWTLPFRASAFLGGTYNGLALSGGLSGTQSTLNIAVGQVLSTSGNYAVTLGFSAVTNATFPAGTYVLSSDGPGFSADKNLVDQTGWLNATYTKVTFTNENWDTNNNFASSTFTPTKAGKYSLCMHIGINGGGGAFSVQLVLYKNGSLFRYIAQQNYDGTIAGNFLVSANGTTDYFEVYAWHNAGSTQVLGGYFCSFQGHFIGP